MREDKNKKNMSPQSLSRNIDFPLKKNICHCTRKPCFDVLSKATVYKINHRKTKQGMS